MRFHSLKFWKKPPTSSSTNSRHDQSVASHIAQTVVPTPNVAAQPSTSTLVTTEESTLATEPVPEPVPEPVLGAPPSQSSPTPIQTSKLRLQEELWNQAYSNIKSEEPDLLEKYEKLLSSKDVAIDNIRNDETQHESTLSTQQKWDQMKKIAEAGLQETQQSTNIQGKVDNAFQLATPIKAMIDKIMPVVPQAQVPWLAVSLAFEIFSNPFKEPGINRTGLLYVISNMEWYMNLGDHCVDGSGQQLQVDLHRRFKEHTVELYQKLLLYQIKSIYCFHKNGMDRFLRNTVRVDDWSGQLNDIKVAEAVVWKDVEAFQNQVMVDHLRKQSDHAQHSLNALKEISLGIHDLIRKQQEIKYEQDNRECRQALHQTNPSHDRERILSAKGTLLRESYSWVIRHPQFKDWQVNAQHRRLWIRGDAGKGKTMLLCGIIEELEKNPFHRLCYFFCQATDERLRDARCVLRGLLFHLVKQYPWLISHVRKDYDDSGEKLFTDHNAWQALCKIFKSVLNDEGLDEVIIIVDALDECMVHREELLDFICEISAGSRAKLIVSSRPWSHIASVLQDGGPGSTTLALELNDQLISDAVINFIDSRVQDLAKRKPYKNDTGLCTTITKHLTQNAESTFLWVALVCQELSQITVTRSSHVTEILKNSPPGLDKLYERMLESIRRESRDFALCKEILAVNSVVARPVTISELLCIMDSEMASGIDLSDLQQVIMSCGSFLHLQEGIVYFIHQSAVDFLKGNSSRLPEIAERHHSVFRNALNALQECSELKRDIYNLEDPATAQSDIKEPRLNPLSSILYSCIHWGDHLNDYILHKEAAEDSRIIPSEDVSVVYKFLESKFLFWIESLILLHKLPEAVKTVQKLQKLFGGRSSSAEPSIEEFIHDANRFLLYHRPVIEKYPLQLYAACLLFSPERSIVKSCFRPEAPEWIKVVHGLNTTWDACMGILDEERSTGYPLAHSIDGQWLVSGCTHGAVTLWDAESGTCIYTIDDHGEDNRSLSINARINLATFTNSVAFEVDGKSIVSATLRGSVKVWDRLTGALVSQHQAHQSRASHMAISADGLTVASILPDYIIRVWSRNKKIPSWTFLGPKEDVRSIALSANGEWLATTTPSSRRCMIWNTCNKEQQAIIADHGACLVTWSTDGQWIAIGGDNGFVQVWEKQSGHWSPKIAFQMETKYGLYCVISSFDSRFLAAASESIIYVWDIMTGILKWKKDEDADTGFIISLSFSHDNLRLLSGTMAHEIKIWDISKTQENRLRFPEDGLQRICWSDADCLAAYFSEINEIMIWGRDKPQRLYATSFFDMVISPDNQQLATTPVDLEEAPIKIWDLRSGEMVRQLVESSNDTSERNFGGLAFGNQGQLASTTTSGLIKIWDTSNGSCVRTLDDDGDSDNYLMTFSNTGRWLAFLSYDSNAMKGKIKLWDTVTGKCTTMPSEEPISIHTTGLTFSADSRQLAASARTSILCGSTVVIHVWDVSSGKLLRKFKNQATEDIHACFDSRNERRLHTEYGFFDMPTTLCPDAPDSTCSRSDEEDTKDAGSRVEIERMPPFSGYGLSYDKDWIMLNGQRLVLIPREYKFDNSTGSDCECSPVIDGSRIIWTRELRCPVLIHFITQN